MLPKIKKEAKNISLTETTHPKDPFNIFTFSNRVTKLIDSETYIWIKNVFRADQYLSFPVTERDFTFS